MRLTDAVISAPLELIEPHIRRLWKVRLNDRQIVAELQKHIDTSQYGIGCVVHYPIWLATDTQFRSLTKFVEIRNTLGLKRTRQQDHTPESIHDAMIELRKMYPNAGMREMISLIFDEHNMCVSR